MQENANLCDFQPILRLIKKSGAVACGVKEIGAVPEKLTNSYICWLREGKNAGMTYLENHQELRSDPRRLLEGAKSIISIAFSYHQEGRGEIQGMSIASYAVGDDYHDVLRERLRPVIEELKCSYGAESRICIDSAPIHERYWAVECGLGSLCANGNLYVPGVGTEVFLAEIITTAAFTTDSKTSNSEFNNAPESMANGANTEDKCNGCGACKRICPGGAIGEEGIIDSRRCINYLTIEHKGEFSDEQFEIMRRAGGLTLIGCDRCQRVCHLNQGKPATGIGEFNMREAYRTLTAESISEMEQAEFSKIFKGSPLKRAKLAGLRRNLAIAKSKSNGVG